jgi:outer membrane protein TolC
VGKPVKFARGLAAALTSIALTGCFGPLAKRLADKEVYPIIAQKQMEALDRMRPFTIDERVDPTTAWVMENAPRASDQFTTAGLSVTLGQTIALSLGNSRQYQSQKEGLYQSAQSLTAERHDFSPIFSGSVSGTVSRSPAAGGGVNRQLSGSSRLAVSQLFASGARATVSLTNNFSRFLNGPPDEVSPGSIGAVITQPLLRGAGMRIALENLIQAERNMIYDVRDFARFERAFIISRIDDYFRTLQQLDAVRNDQAALRSVRESREQAEAQSDAGKTPLFQVFQAQSRELTASDRLNSSQTAYSSQLDRFKFNLGLPIDIALIPDESELDRFTQVALEPPALTQNEAVELALIRRLDYLTTKDAVEDVARRLHIAENSLLPNFDLSASIRYGTKDKAPLDFLPGTRSYDVGVDLELPLDRKNERNSYARALIQVAGQRRNLEQTRDQIIQEVRAEYRNLQEALSSYRIQIETEKIDELRLENNKILFENGRVQIIDILDAEEDLRNSRNARTRALVNYVLSRLRFLLAIEALDVDEDGNLIELDPVQLLAESRGRRTPGSSEAEDWIRRN